MNNKVPNDQAHSLRKKVAVKSQNSRGASDGVRVIAVSGGKGGVGKSNVSVNLAISLSKIGDRVALLDADLGLANVDILLGVGVSYNLSHVLSGEKTLEEIVIKGPGGVLLIPGASGLKDMTSLDINAYRTIVGSFANLNKHIDTLIIDTAAGIFDGVINFAGAAQEVIIVVCDEPSSITDAYALMKVLKKEKGMDSFHVLANMIRRVNEGKELFAKLTLVCERFLGVHLHYLGAIPFDEKLRKSVQMQKAIVEAFPATPSSLALKRLAKQVKMWPVKNSQYLGLDDFAERVVSRVSGG